MKDAGATHMANLNVVALPLAVGATMACANCEMKGAIERIDEDLGRFYVKWNVWRCPKAASW